MGKLKYKDENGNWQNLAPSQKEFDDFKDSTVSELADTAEKVGDNSDLPSYLPTDLFSLVKLLDLYIRDYGINVKRPPYNAYGDANFFNEDDGKWYADSEFTQKAHDDSAVIQQAINDATKKTLPVFIPYGFYLVNTGLIIPSSANTQDSYVSIKGYNRYKCGLRKDNNTNTNYIIKIVRNGRNVGGSISDIRLDADQSKDRGIIKAGCINYDSRRVLFGRLYCGTEFFNDKEGDYTELCNEYDCDFSYSCLIAVHYVRNVGDSSFHGSGITGNSRINDSVGNKLPKILISSGCNPYNAPLSFTMWTRNLMPIIQNKAGNMVTFYGSIKIETAHTDGKIDIVDRSFGTVNFCGNVLSAGTDIRYGNLIQSYRLETDNGNIYRSRMPYSINLISTDLKNEICILGPEEPIIAHVFIQNSLMWYSYTVLARKNRDDGNGSIDIITKHYSNPDYENNPEGSFSVENSRLYYNGTFASDTKIGATISTIGAGSLPKLFQ